MTEPSEFGLIRQAQAGDRQALAGLIARLQDRWFRMARVLTGSADQAQDAVQETALRFLDYLYRFGGESSVSTWSLGILINVCREMHRRNHKAGLWPESSVAAPSCSESPSEHLAAEELRGRALSLIQNLPARQREAVVLRFLEQVPIEATARLLGCAEGTVKALSHQGLRSLRRALAGDQTNEHTA